MMCMCMSFSTIFILLRLYTKLVLIKSHAWEDCERASHHISVSVTDKFRYILPCMGNSLPPLLFLNFIVALLKLMIFLKFGLMGYLCVDFVAFSHGAGIHQWNVPREQIPTYSKVRSKVRPKKKKKHLVDGLRRCMQKKLDMRRSFFSPSSRFYCNSCEFSCPDDLGGHSIASTPSSG